MNVIDNFFQSVQNLPMMPKVVQDVMQMLDQEDVDLKAIEKTIAHDQVIAAKVLRLANSSYYGLSRKIGKLEDAISLIGLDNLRMIVIACGVTGSFTLVTGLDMNRFWRHSLLTASVARQLCKEQKRSSDTAYVAALMHSIGQLPIHLVFPAAGAEIEEMCQGLSVIERKAVENATLGLDHCQVGEELARRWNFPDDIQRVIRYYANPLDQNACELAPLVYLAAHIAFGLERGDSSEAIVAAIDPDVAQVLKIDVEVWAEKVANYGPLLAEAESFL